MFLSFLLISATKFTNKLSEFRIILLGDLANECAISLAISIFFLILNNMDLFELHHLSF